ncbi:MAG: DUF4292 domain-containing protein [Bacteroidota bacterium]
MQKLLTNFLLLIFLVLMASACKTSKEAVGDLKRKPPRYLVERLKDNQRQYEWFSGKGKLKFTSEGKTQSATTNIRMRKDSLIWINVTKIGFEAARMLITPDSVHILLRREKEYYAREFQAFADEYNLDIDFNTLQQIVLGNALLPDSRKLDSKIDPPHYLLTAKDGIYTREFRMGGSDYLLAQMKVSEPSTNRTFTVDYETYKAVSNASAFAYDRSAIFTQDDVSQAELDIRFSKIELDIPKNTPFSISSRYARK